MIQHLIERKKSEIYKVMTFVQNSLHVSQGSPGWSLLWVGFDHDLILWVQVQGEILQSFVMVLS